MDAEARRLFVGHFLGVLLLFLAALAIAMTMPMSLEFVDGCTTVSYRSEGLTPLARMKGQAFCWSARLGVEPCRLNFLLNEHAFPPTGGTVLVGDRRIEFSDIGIVFKGFVDVPRIVITDEIEAEILGTIPPLPR